MKTQIARNKHKPVITSGGKSRGRRHEGQHAHVKSVLHGRRIQPKLSVGQPNDKYEQEADRVAEQVMRMPVAQPGSISSADHSPPGNPNPHSGTIQRACAACAAEQDHLQRAPLPTQMPLLQRQEMEDEEPFLQTKQASDASPGIQPGVEAKIAALRGGGQPLPASERAFFEPRFGQDFSQVRVHTDAAAATSAHAVKALAFTVGSDVVFGTGKYAPGTGTGRRLIAHELTHVIQQNGPRHTPVQASPAINHGQSVQPHHTVIQRRTALDEQEFGRLPGVPDTHASVSRVTPPNATASAPPTPTALPGPGSFAPLNAAELADRTSHGLSRDTGPMLGEIESELFPTGGSNPPCTPMPADFEGTVAAALSAALIIDVPDLTPTAAPDPMALASESATEAMPIINSHYSPHAPSVSPASFMARVSRKQATFGDPIRNSDARLAEFLSWYAGARSSIRSLTSDKCGMNRAWWVGFAGWLGGAGSSWNDPPHDIRERSALFDTFLTSVTSGGRIKFGLSFPLHTIPHTVVHEAMHLFQHADLRTQVNRLQNLRSSKDIIIEGFAEYLARGVRDQVVTALQGHTPPELSATEETRARKTRAYPFYFDKAVEIRDILYRHGQDGEEAIRRAFFLGEGWRFGLLETDTGIGSPFETDRPVPSPVDVHFDTNRAVILDAAALDPIIAYVTTRSIATVEVVGRADPEGSTTRNITVGQQRADAAKAHLIGAGVNASRISTSSRGEADQILGGNDVNRRATVTVIDPRNAFPGLPAPGRP